jgi:hypothetical protein
MKQRSVETEAPCREQAKRLFGLLAWIFMTNFLRLVYYFGDMKYTL